MAYSIYLFPEKLHFINPCFLTKSLYKVTSSYLFLKYIIRVLLYLVFNLTVIEILLYKAEC